MVSTRTVVSVSVLPLLRRRTVALLDFSRTATWLALNSTYDMSLSMKRGSGVRSAPAWLPEGVLRSASGLSSALSNVSATANNSRTFSHRTQLQGYYIIRGCFVTFGIYLFEVSIFQFPSSSSELSWSHRIAELLPPHRVFVEAVPKSRASLACRRWSLWWQKRDTRRGCEPVHPQDARPPALRSPHLSVPGAAIDAQLQWIRFLSPNTIGHATCGWWG